MYVRIVSWLTLPAVEAKYERVPMDGSLSRCGNSLCREKDVTPLHAFTTSAALSEGVARTNRYEQVEVVWRRRQRQHLPAVLGALALDQLTTPHDTAPPLAPPTPTCGGGDTRSGGRCR
jgi:hypothetical protein